MPKTQTPCDICGGEGTVSDCSSGDGCQDIPCEECGGKGHIVRGSPEPATIKRAGMFRFGRRKS